MKKALFTLCLVMTACWLYAQEDSLRANRFVMRANMIGIGVTNQLDTYLSPASYTGTEFRYLHEHMRMTRWMEGKVSVQSIFQLNFSNSTNKRGNGSVWAGMANWSYGWHYQQTLSKNLKVLYGPLVDLNGGFIYNLRNSNNPAQARAYGNIDASAAVIYKFKIGNLPLVARYQLNLPLLGVMFSPEYGQSYYEIFDLKYKGKNVLFTSLHNQPSLRQFLTLDVPIHTTNLRVGYVCDTQQAHVNQLKNHSWSHVFMIGIVKNVYLLKGRNRVSMPADMTPF